MLNTLVDKIAQYIKYDNFIDKRKLLKPARKKYYPAKMLHDRLTSMYHGFKMRDYQENIPRLTDKEKIELIPKIINNLDTIIAVSEKYLEQTKNVSEDQLMSPDYEDNTYTPKYTLMLFLIRPGETIKRELLSSGINESVSPRRRFKQRLEQYKSVRRAYESRLIESKAA